MHQMKMTSLTLSVLSGDQFVFYRGAIALKMEKTKKNKIRKKERK
jgi:hypothetical protein